MYYILTGNLWFVLEHDLNIPSLGGQCPTIYLFLVVLHMQDKQETYFLLSGGNILKLNFPSIFSARVNVLSEHKTQRLYCPAGGASEISTLSLKTKTKKRTSRIQSEVSSRRRVVVNLTIKMSKYWKTVKSTRCLRLRSSMISIRCILETSGKHFALLSARCQRRLQNRYVCVEKKRKNI